MSFWRTLISSGLGYVILISFYTMIISGLETCVKITLLCRKFVGLPLSCLAGLPKIIDNVTLIGTLVLSMLQDIVN